MDSKFKFVFVQEVVSTAFRGLSNIEKKILKVLTAFFFFLAEQVNRLEDEKAAIHQEYEQERIAYQKLLKDFNRLEQANENLQEEVFNLRGGGNRHNRNVSSVSMASSFVGDEDMSLRVGEEESAYGSVSGRSSLVSTLDRRDRDRQLESLTVLPETAQPDVGLMMKLQGALKDAYRVGDLFCHQHSSGQAPHSPQYPFFPSRLIFRLEGT